MITDDERKISEKGIDDPSPQSQPIKLQITPPPPPVPFPEKPDQKSAKWSDLVPTTIECIPSTPDRRAQIDSVVRTLLRTNAGQQLVNDLWATLVLKSGKRSTLRLHFRPHNNFPAGEDDESAPTDAAGFYSPARRRAAVYDLYVGWERDFPANTIQTNVSGIYTTIRSGTSFMVETLSHEMLHIWFIHSGYSHGPDEQPETGHTQMEGRAYNFVHPIFQRRQSALLKELEQIEASQNDKKDKPQR